MVLILICDRRHALISPVWLKVGSCLGLISPLQSKELRVKGFQGRKVTPAAKAPCVFQQPRVSLTSQDMLFWKSRWQPDSKLVAFCSRLVLCSLWKLQVSACSALQPQSPADVCSPQRICSRKPRQTLPRTGIVPWARPSPLPLLWRRSLQGEECWLMKTTQAGPNKSSSHLY